MNLVFEKSLRRRFFKKTHASGGVSFAEREIFFDCRPLSGNQKLTILCDPCALCERSSFVLRCDWVALRNPVHIILRPLIILSRSISQSNRFVNRNDPSQRLRINDIWL